MSDKAVRLNIEHFQCIDSSFNTTEKNASVCETFFNHSAHGFRNPLPEDTVMKTLRLVAEVYLSMPIAILGIIGNLLSLVVLCYHRRMKNVNIILIQLQVLAIVDTLTLFNGLLLRSLRYVLPVSYSHAHTLMFPWLYPIQFFLRLFGIWLTVLLTVDRYIAVWYPLDAKRLCTVNRTYLLMIIIATGSALFSMPRFFEYTIREFTPGRRGFVATNLPSNSVYNFVYAITLFTLMQYILPTIVLVCLNTRVIVALRRSDTYRSSVNATQILHRSMVDLTTDQSQRLSTSFTQQPVNATFQSTRSITVVVTAIVMMCITVHVVALIAHVIWCSQSVAPNSLKFFLEPASRHLSQASNVLVTLNSAVNFLVYCVFSRNFRSVLARRLGLTHLVNAYRSRRGTSDIRNDDLQRPSITCCAFHRLHQSIECELRGKSARSKPCTTCTNESR